MLTDDLRAAFQDRAHEIPDAPAPGLIVGYTAPLPTRARRRWPLAVSGAVAAGLLTIGFVAAGGDSPEPSTPLAQTASTQVPSIPRTDAPEGAFITGEVGGHPYAMVSRANEEGVDDVTLEAEGLEGSFKGEYQLIRMAQDAADEAFLFAQIGPCCKLAGHTMFVGVFAPDVVSATLTPVGSDVPPMRAETTASPGAVDGYRYLVVPIPAGVRAVHLEAHKADGTSEQVGSETWNLDVVGG